jgi:hypothetical protein
MELKISELSLSYVVCGRRLSLLVNRVSDTQTIWQLSAGDEKLIPALKMNILWDTAGSIPYLVPTQIPGTEQKTKKTKRRSRTDEEKEWEPKRNKNRIGTQDS